MTSNFALELIIFFDNYLISTGKTSLSLRTANELLKREEKYKEINLKELLEDGNYVHAYQTDIKPKQWYIKFSKPEEYRILRKEFLKSHKTGNRTDKSKSGFWILFVLIIAIIGFYKGCSKEEVVKIPANSNNLNETNQTFVEPKESNNNSDTRNSDEAEDNNSVNSGYDSENKQFYNKTLKPGRNVINLNQLTGKKFTFRSTLNDKEYNGEIIQTNHETCYDIFDFTTMTITQKSPLHGEWLTITYPIAGFYKEEGLLATTYVFIINTLGVKEIWFSPDVPNYGYDYIDGSRIACYEITRVE